MEVRYKGIKHERCEDAPFVGALISAIDCKFNCEGCFNQYLKELPTQKESAENIIAEVKRNPLNEGIILGGLEWSCQPVELYNLVRTASRNGLKVMIYTGCDETCFDRKIGLSMLGAFINRDFYVKFGNFQPDKSSHKKAFGVVLATDNQYIVKFTKDGSRVVDENSD